MLFGDHFTSYQTTRSEGNSRQDLAIVPENELQELVEFANLAKAAGPAQCNHPADALEAFELIPDCCVCGECGAVLKNYSAHDAAALGIETGWVRLTATLLEAELRYALSPAIGLLDYIHSETGQWGECHDVLTWGESTRRNKSFGALQKAR